MHSALTNNVTHHKSKGLYAFIPITDFKLKNTAKQVMTPVMGISILVVDFPCTKLINS